MSKAIQYLLAVCLFAPLMLCWYVLIHLVLAVLLSINATLEMLLNIKRGKP